MKVATAHISAMKLVHTSLNVKGAFPNALHCLLGAIRKQMELLIRYPGPVPIRGGHYPVSHRTPSLTVTSVILAKRSNLSLKAGRFLPRDLEGESNIMVHGLMAQVLIAAMCAMAAISHLFEDRPAPLAHTTDNEPRVWADYRGYR